MVVNRTWYSTAPATSSGPSVLAVRWTAWGAKFRPTANQVCCSEKSEGKLMNDGRVRRMISGAARCDRVPRHICIDACDRKLRRAPDQSRIPLRSIENAIWFESSSGLLAFAGFVVESDHGGRAEFPTHLTRIVRLPALPAARQLAAQEAAEIRRRRMLRQVGPLHAQWARLRAVICKSRRSRGERPLYCGKTPAESVIVAPMFVRVGSCVPEVQPIADVGSIPVANCRRRFGRGVE
jgi:hypothetical protein